MICPACKADGSIVNGSCVKCGVRTGPLCQKCSTPATPGERFCASCGAEIKSPAQRSREIHERADHEAKLGSARKWLAWVSILTCISGVGIYFIQSSQTEGEIRKAEAKMAGMDAAERDAAIKASVGMTWEQVVAQDRGQVRLLLFVNLGLAAAYFVLWIWAGKNAFGASLTALILFSSVIVVSAILEPKSLAQGWLVKIFFTAALLKAVSSGYRERKLYGARA